MRGPALCTWNGGKFFSKEDFGIKLDLDTVKINTSASMEQDERVININPEASLTPEGRFTNALCTALWNPFATYVRGASLLTSSNLPFVASAADGEIHTMVAGAMTKLPDIYLSAKKTMLGSMTIKGYRGLAAGWGTAGSMYTVVGTGGSVVDSTYSPQGIIVQPYTGAWGSITGFTNIDTEDGWTIQFNLKTKDWEVDTVGKVDVTFESLEVMAKCTPVGPTSAQIANATTYQSTVLSTVGTVRGYSLANPTITTAGSGGAFAPNLVITGADGATIIQLNQANIKTEGFQFGNTKLRAGEIGWVATRPFSSGVPGALFSLTAPL